MNVTDVQGMITGDKSNQTFMVYVLPAHVIVKL